MNYFIFNGLDSRDFGIHIDNEPNIVKPTRKLNTVSIDGRSGYLLYSDIDNEEVLDSFSLSITCTLSDERKLPNIMSWLNGYGKLILSNNSNKYYNALITNQIDFERVFRKFKAFTVIFECQPYAYEIENETISNDTSSNLLTLTSTNNVLKVPSSISNNIKSAILKGRTLVNLNRGERSITLDSTTGISSERIYRCKLLNEIPSGTYLTFKIKTNTTDGITGNLKAGLQTNTGTSKYYKLRDYSTNPSGDYYVNFCLQISDNVVDIIIFIDDNKGLLDISDVMVLIGDHTQEDIPFFEGMTSVKMPVLKSTGKNLLNSQNITYKSTYNTVDMIIKNTLKPNIEYTISFDRNGINWKGRSFYIKGNNYTNYKSIQNSDSERVALTFSLTDEDVNVLNTNGYLQIYNALVTSESTKPTNIQIEENSTNTDYEPYKSNILTVNEDVTLRSNGDICDELNLLTGQLTQRIGEDGVVLSQEVVKTVGLSIVNQNEEKLDNITLFSGGTVTVTSNSDISLNLNSEMVFTVLSDFIIENQTNTFSKPLITIYGNGEIDLIVNGKILNLTIDEYITIDFDLQNATKGILNRNNCVVGDYSEFRFKVGTNIITVKGNATKIEITPNFRWY